MTWHGEKVAYPFFFETSALLYNKTLLAQMAEQAGIDVSEAQPRTILDIIRLADSYNAPEGVDAIFKWDVSDIFNNFYFVGSCIDVGGPDGDNRDQVRIYTPEAIQSLQVYQQLGQFFSVDMRMTMNRFWRILPRAKSSLRSRRPMRRKNSGRRRRAGRWILNTASCSSRI